MDRGAAARRLMSPVSSWVTGAAGSSFLRTVSLTFGTRVAGLAVGVLTLTATTRLLGPEGRGQYAVVMTALALVLQVSHCGLHSASVFFLARRPELRRDVGALLLWASLGITGPVALATFALAAVVPSMLGSVPLGLLGLGLVAAPAAMFVLLAANALLGLGRAPWFNGLELGTRLVGLAAAGLLLWWPLSTQFAAYVALTYLLAGVAYARLLGPAVPRPPRLPLTAAMFGYGLRAFLSTLLMVLVLRAGLFLLNALAGTAAAGRYSVALNVAEIVSLAAASVNAILFPRLSSMTPARRWSTARRVARSTGAVLALMALGLAVVGRPVIVAWFGLDFEPAVVALWWLLPGMWCLGVNSVLYQYLAAAGMPWFVVGAPLVGVAATTVLSLALIPALGIAGAAAACTLTCVLLLLGTLGYLTWYAGAVEPPTLPSEPTPVTR
jgi:O-antigen/teichoic acid export membrane protein